MTIETPTPIIVNEGRHLPKVLIVDDDQATLGFLEESLKAVPFEVYLLPTAGMAKRLLDHLKNSERPIAIVVDVSMPLEDGVTTMREIRKNERDMNRPPIKAAFYTGLKEDPDLPRFSQELGIQRIFAKPDDTPQFGQCLIEWLGLEGDK